MASRSHGLLSSETPYGEVVTEEHRVMNSPYNVERILIAFQFAYTHTTKIIIYRSVKSGIFLSCTNAQSFFP